MSWPTAVRSRAAPRAVVVPRYVPPSWAPTQMPANDNRPGGIRVGNAANDNIKGRMPSSIPRDLRKLNQRDLKASRYAGLKVPSKLLSSALKSLYWGFIFEGLGLMPTPHPFHGLNNTSNLLALGWELVQNCGQEPRIPTSALNTCGAYQFGDEIVGGTVDNRAVPYKSGLTWIIRHSYFRNFDAFNRRRFSNAWAWRKQALAPYQNTQPPTNIHNPESPGRTKPLNPNHHEAMVWPDLDSGFGTSPMQWGFTNPNFKIPFRLLPHVRTNPNRSRREQTERGPKPIEKPWPRPPIRPRPEPEVDPVHPPPPVVVTDTFHVRRPPERGERERKTLASGGIVSLLRYVNAATEAADAIEALWEAIPKNLRGKSKKVQDMTADLWKHWRSIDIRNAVINLIMNQIEDFAYGQIGKLSKTVKQELWNQMRLEYPQIPVHTMRLAFREMFGSD